MVLSRSEYTVTKVYDGEDFYRAWADTPDGSGASFSTTDSNRLYLGTYVGLTAPTTYTQYKWTKVKGESAVVGNLDNDSHQIGTDSNGQNGNYYGANSTLTIFRGGINDTANWNITHTIAPAGSITGTASNTNRTYTVTNLTVDEATVTFTAKDKTNKDADIVKVFSVSKNKQGVAGEEATNYTLSLSTTSIKKDKVTQTLIPSTLKSTGLAVLGQRDPEPHAGYFIIYEQAEASLTRDGYEQIYLDGLTDPDDIYILAAENYPFVETYRSSQAETFVDYFSEELLDAIAVRVKWYKDSQFTNLLDMQTVSVVSDGIDGRQGAPGTSVTGVVEHYLATNMETGVTVSTPNWKTTMQKLTTTNKYLWNYEEINFSDGSKQSTLPVIIGVYGDTGNTGATGRSIVSIAENYLATSAATGVTRSTGGWTPAVQPTTTTNRYLWNYEIITWSAAPFTTYIEPIVVGVHGLTGPQGEKGATGTRGPQGATGTSVTGAIEYYLASSAETGITTSTSGWKTTMQQMTSTNKYLWNYEEITFSDGSKQPTLPVVIGVYGDTGNTGQTGATGRSITSIEERYLATTAASGVTRSTSGWTPAVQPTSDAKKYLWNYEIVNWSVAPLITYVEPIVIGVHGTKGDVGTSVVSITEEYAQNTSATTSPTVASDWSATRPTWKNGQYIWTRSKIVYANPSSTVHTQAKNVTGGTGSTGAAGQSVDTVDVEYATNTSSTVAPTGGWLTTAPEWKPGNYIWQRTKVVYKNPVKTEYTGLHCIEAQAFNELSNKFGEFAFRDKTDLLSGNPIWTDKADENGIVHVEVDGKSYQHAGSGKNLLGKTYQTVSGTYAVSGFGGANYSEIENGYRITGRWTSFGWKIMLKPSVKYTISGKLTMSNTENKNEQLYVRVNNYSGSSVNAASFTVATTNERFSFTFTSRHDDVEDVIAFATQAAEGALTVFDITDIQLEEGSVVTSYEPPAPTPDYPIEIHSLNDFDVVSSVGKENLLPNSLEVLLNFNNSGGIDTHYSEGPIQIMNVGAGRALSTYNNKIHFDFSRLIDGEEYTYSYMVNPSIDSNMYIDWSKPQNAVLAKANMWTQISYTQKYNANIANSYLMGVASSNNTSATTYKLTKPKIEKGAKATPWCPSIPDVGNSPDTSTLDKINLLLDEPLRSVGDVKDRLFRDSDGLWKVERKIEQVSYNGTEYWNVNDRGGVDTFSAFRTIPSIKSGLRVGDHFDKHIVSHFTNKQVYQTSNEASMINNSKALYIRINSSKLPSADLNGFKSWLSQNNITVLYVADEKIETLSQSLQDKLNNLRTFKESNYIYTVLPGKSGILTPELTATFKSRAWADNYKSEKGINESIHTVDTWFAKSVSTTIAPNDNQYTTDTPEWEDGFYIWMKVVKTYNDGRIVEGKPACITGATGRAIDRIEEWYYRSTSDKTQVGGQWSLVSPTWLDGTYIWTKLKMFFKNPSGTEETDPINTTGAKGAAGVDARTIILSNESHSFAGDVNNALAGSVSVNVQAYIGTTRVPASVGEATGMPTGMSMTTSGSGTTSSAFNINVTTALVSKSGIINIPIIVSGQTFTKQFSYSVAFKGSAGHDAEVITLSASSQVFSKSKTGVITPANIVVSGYAQNTTIAAWEYSVNGGIFGGRPAGVTISGNLVTVNGSSTNFNTLAIKAKNGSVEDVVTLARVEDGIDGNHGVSVTKVDAMFYLSTSKNSLLGGSWTTVAPAWKENHYMWTKTVTTYSSGLPTETLPVNLTGATGGLGADGKSVSKLTEEYYLSTSKTALAGGGWTTTPPTWTNGKYMWTRIKIDYTNPVDVGHTDPVVDTAWEAIDGIELGGRNLVIRSSEQKGKGIGVTGAIENIASSSLAPDIPVTGGQSFYLQKSYLDRVGYEYFRVGWYTSSNVFISRFASGTDGMVATAPSSAAIMRVSYPTVATVKVEKGNKPTDWTPSPEDVAAAAEEVAQAKAIVAETNAKAHADGKVTAEEQARIADANAKLTAAKDYADSVGAGINVGGNNLLKGSRDVYLSSNNNDDYPLSKTRMIEGNRSFTRLQRTSLNLNPTVFSLYSSMNMSDINSSIFDNETTVVSFKARASQSVTMNTMKQTFGGQSVISGSLLNIVVTPEWQTFYSVFPKIPASVSGIRVNPLTVLGNINLTNFYLDLAEWKIESGNKPTDWSPAPEDIYEHIGSKNLLDTTDKVYSRDISIGNLNWRETNYVNLELVRNKEYVFSVYLKADSNVTITSPIFFNPTNRSSANAARVITNQWQRFVYPIVWLGGDYNGTVFSPHIYHTTAGAGKIYATRPQLEEGTVPTAWSPAPQDVQIEIDKATYNPVRYIRDWANGSNINTGNHWMEIQANNTRGINVALGKTVSTSGTNTSLAVAVDGITGPGYASAGAGTVYLQVDLGSIYYDITEVKVWRYYTDNRIYKDTKTEVSTDGVTWYPVFDSFVEGIYTEVASGRTMPNTQANSLSLLQAKSALGRLGDKTSQVVIDGGNITAGEIASVNRHSWVNLDDGKFNFGNGGLVWNGSTMTIKGNIAAGDISSGTLNSSRIPNLGAGKISGGRLEATNNPTLNYFDLNNGQFRVGNASSYMHWTGSALNINVNQLTIGGAVAATAAYADNVGASIDIGSTNLVLNSGLTVSSSAYMVAEYFISEDFIAGQTYTAIMKGTKLATQQFGLWQNVGSSGRGNFSNKGNGIWELTFSSVGTTAGNARRIQIYQPSSTTAGAAKIEWFKLVKGNKASYDWSPAPIDLASKEELKVSGKVAIHGGNITASTVTANQIASNAITTVKINANAITTDKIATNAVTANEIAANTITAANIKAGSLTIGSIDSDTTAKIEAGGNAFGNAKTYVIENTGNLVNNPAVSGNMERWSGSGLTYFNGSWNGNTTGMLRSIITTDAQNLSSVFEIDTSKAYEVSLWYYKSIANSPGFYFGVYGYNSGGTRIGFRSINASSGDVSKTDDNNFYFNTGPAQTSWTKVVGYIMPYGTPDSDLKGLGQNSGQNAIFPPHMKRMQVRFLNYSNAGTSRTVFVANPKVVEVDPNSIIRATQAKFLTDTWVHPGTTEINGGNIRTGTLSASSITTGTLDANKVSVTNLTAENITAGTINGARIPNLNASKITAGALGVDRVPNLDAGKVTSGTFAAVRIPNLDANKITTGTLDAARISAGSLTIGKMNAAFNNSFNAKANEFEMTILARASAGKVLNNDPTFLKSNALAPYGIPSVTRENSPSGSQPTDSTYRIKIVATKASPTGWGGIVYNTMSRINAEFVIKFNAHLPTGRTFRIANNQIGNGFQINWLTDNKGKGTWVEYAYYVKCGTGGIFSTFGHLAIEGGAAPTTASPLTWYISRYEMIDISGSANAVSHDDIGKSGRVTIHGGNITASQIDVNKIGGNKSTFATTLWTSLNSSMTADGDKIRITNTAGDFAEMNNIPEFRSQDKAGTSTIMGKGRTHYYSMSGDKGAPRFYIGTSLPGDEQGGSTVHGIHVAQGQTWGIYRRVGNAGGSPRVVHNVKQGDSPVGITEMYMGTYFSNVFATAASQIRALNGWGSSWPTIHPGNTVILRAAVSGTASAIERVWSIGTSGGTNPITRSYTHVEHFFESRIDVTGRGRFVAAALFENGFVNNSDRRIKNSIEPTQINALTEIDPLEFVRYNLNSSGKYVPIGLIAQDSGVLRVRAETEEDYEGIDGLTMPMLALKGVQELHAIIKKQQEQINALKELIGYEEL